MLIQAVTGVEMEEMPHNRQNSLCCGGGEAAVCGWMAINGKKTHARTSDCAFV